MNIFSRLLILPRFSLTRLSITPVEERFLSSAWTGLEVERYMYIDIQPSGCCCLQALHYKKYSTASVGVSYMRYGVLDINHLKATVTPTPRQGMSLHWSQHTAYHLCGFSLINSGSYE